MAFDHMCSCLKKQKIVIDSDMHVMLAAFSAMNKRIKAIFDQVDSGKEYNESIDRHFTAQVILLFVIFGISLTSTFQMALEDVILDNEHDAFDGANEEVEVATKAPSDVSSSLSTAGPTPKRRRMLPRLTKFIKKGPPEGMVSIDEVPITQLEAMAHVGGQFEDDVGEYVDEEKEVEADNSAEKLRLETEANATQDSNYTPEVEVTHGTIASNGTDGICDDDIEVMRGIRKPSAKAIAAMATIGVTAREEDGEAAHRIVVVW
jgi:hypothetical protein